MNGEPQQRRKQVNGVWYERNVHGGWVPVGQPATATMSSSPSPRSPETTQDTPVQLPVAQPEVASGQTTDVLEARESPKKSRKKRVGVVIAVVLGLMVATLAAGAWWYQTALKPVAASGDNVRVTVKAGSSPAMIGDLLYAHNLIRSPLAFDMYTRLTNNRGNLQMGTYTLSPTLSLNEIVEHLTSGKVDTYTLTIFSGEALRPPLKSTSTDGKDVRSVLLRAGFTPEQVDAAFMATYDSPLLAGRPAGGSLEGYIFPDTYTVDSSMSAEQFIAQTLQTYEKVVEKNDLRAKFKARGLSLAEGITLASIIEKEMGRYTADMPQVAQVFYTRLAMKMQLGSDVTAYYGADRIGAPRAVTVDTPYNTRMHTGMPPGPIGMPSEAALIAAANPAPGDYVFFLSGDDGKNYFARTDAEHQKNIVDHCQVGCSIP